MTKQETQIMKGVAILLMMFLHLFNQLSNVELCKSFIYIGDIPFVYWLSAAANPVAFFLILSGYGMHFIHVRGKGDTHRWNASCAMRNLKAMQAVRTGIMCATIAMPDGG